MKVKIYKNPYKAAIDILIYEEREGKRYIAQPVTLVFKEWKEGETIEPTLTVAHFLEDEFLKALAEALDEKGIKTDKDAKIEGLLEATRHHLEDLRRLLKLRK
jgi:hypothetical protein